MAFRQIIGRVGKDPETKQTSKGPLLKFSVAVNEGYGSDEKTTWYAVVVFNEGLQASARSEVYKGALIAVEGPHRQDTYNGKTSESVLANRIFLVQPLQRSKRADTLRPVNSSNVLPPPGYAPNLQPAKPTSEPAGIGSDEQYDF